MRRSPIRLRTVLLGAVLALLLLPTLAGGLAWVLERDHQHAGVQQRLNTAFAYLASRRAGIENPRAIQGFSRMLDRLDLLGQLVIVTTAPPGKHQLYISAALPQRTPQKVKPRQLARAVVTAAPSAASLDDEQRFIPLVASGSQAALVADLYYRPASRTTAVLVALLAGIVILVAGLAVAAWLAGRWMVAPLAGLSAQVDKVAGGDLAIAIPRSRIGEIANIAQAVEGLTAALGDTARRRAEADEARQFLVTSIAHDLRTPLFALRGHLQAIGSRLGNPSVHLERAEARADALERLVGNLFAYTRDDFAQPALRLEAAPVVDLLGEVVAGLEHTARLRDNSFDLEGDQALGVVVDRDRVKRALTNILDNAVRYSPAGAAVHVGWSALDTSTVQIRIDDHGPGIDADILPHVFEPGIRGAPAGDGLDGGAGLGLTIAKRLLEHQHATIGVQNQPAGGARISLSFPRASSSRPS